MIANTPNQISYVRLASLKGMLSLESKGMKGRSGPIRPQIAEELGLRPRAPYETFIAAIKDKLQSLLVTIQEEKSKCTPTH